LEVHGESAVPLRGHETVLVVDDDDSLRRMLKATLTRYGYQVKEACSGEEAVDVWRNLAGQVDLLLTDMVMPEGMSGLELARRLREGNARLKVIITSGYVMDLDLDLAGENIRCLLKPYAPADLARAVRECLDTPEG
jgi:two-component system, cell cycle sensor histidine kinase and response regulator CckA